MPDHHIFALYYPLLSERYGVVPVDSSFEFDDRELVHRMTRVLRLHTGKELVLFDRDKHMHVTIQATSEKKATLFVKEAKENHPLQPTINLGLPLLKRRDLEEAIYAATEVGMNSIHLIETDKCERACDKQALYERLERVSIAAAEQAKQFALPPIHTPVPLEVWLQRSTGITIFFDPDGSALYEVAGTLRDQQPQTINLLVGPEGDLISKEKETLRAKEATFCSLTPTVLRAHQAIAVGCGAIRALLI